LEGAHSREELAGLLWGEAGQANARASLRRALADLRQAMDPHMLLGYSEVALDWGLPYRVDVTEFRRGLAQARVEWGYALTEDSAAALDQAVALLRGDFLAGFHVHKAPAFEEWVVMERERLHLLALQALHALAHHHAARGPTRRRADTSITQPSRPLWRSSLAPGSLRCPAARNRVRPSRLIRIVQDLR
jgi:DNA-binding SARP family transcriptional activator